MNNFILLENADVKITKNEGMVGSIKLNEGKYKDKKINLASLYYTFIMKDTSSDQLFFHSSNLNKIKLRIEPCKELLLVIDKILGLNIYDIGKNNLGWLQGIEEIDSKGTIKFIMSYTLGTTQESPLLPCLPPKEELQIIKDNALRSTLIVLQQTKEITQFKLSSEN